jgi:hypothetical protein
MLATFSLRLGCGLIAALLLLSPGQINPRFYRTHFLTALGLAAVAAIFLWDTDNAGLAWALGCALVLALLGSMAWMLEGVPLGRALIALTTVAFALSLGLKEWPGREAPPTSLSGNEGAGLTWLLVDDFTSAAFLGAATTAMLIGHSYLIAPAMSLTPLLRLLGALFATTAVRLAVGLVGLWHWTADPALVTLDTTLWLVPRWGLGFAGPLALGWLAWQTARIRSTQSATGILYVVVIFAFLAELTSQLLLARNGVPM